MQPTRLAKPTAFPMGGRDSENSSDHPKNSSEKNYINEKCLEICFEDLSSELFGVRSFRYLVQLTNDSKASRLLFRKLDNFPYFLDERASERVNGTNCISRRSRTNLGRHSEFFVSVMVDSSVNVHRESPSVRPSDVKYDTRRLAGRHMAIAQERRQETRGRYRKK